MVHEPSIGPSSRPCAERTRARPPPEAGDSRCAGCWAIRSCSACGRRPAACSSGRTSRTSPTRAVRGRSAPTTSGTTGRAPPGAPGSSSRRSRPWWPTTTLTSTRRSPPSARRAGGTSRRPAVRSGRSCSPGSGTPVGRARRPYPAVPLHAPSAVPDPASGEVPEVLDAEGIAAVVAGFAGAAGAAVAAGCDGVEVQAEQHALLRQFLSGLTNQRDDAYGADRGLLLAEVLSAVRAPSAPTRSLVCAWPSTSSRRGRRHSGRGAGGAGAGGGARRPRRPGAGLGAVGRRDAARRAHAAGIPAPATGRAAVPGVAMVLAGSVVDAVRRGGRAGAPATPTSSR